MQIRCTYCQMMFAVNHEEILAALENMEEENLRFYDAHCPKCRRANRIERLKLESSYPGWRDEIKKMTKAAAESARPATVTPATASMPKVGSTASPKKKHSHKPAEKPAVKPTPKAVKTPTNTKPAPTKPGNPAKGKPIAKTTKKPASKPAKKPVGKPTAGTKKK